MDCNNYESRYLKTRKLRHKLGMSYLILNDRNNKIILENKNTREKIT